MIIKSKYIKPKFKKTYNPKVGLLALTTDLTIEKDFNSIFNQLPIDVFVNRIHNENPLTKENLLKMSDQIEGIAEKILPGEKINTVAYGCTSGTIAIGEDRVKEKIQLAKPDCYVTTPITSAIKAFKLMNIKKIAVFTPYPDSVNKTIFEISLGINKRLTHCLFKVSSSISGVNHKSFCLFVIIHPGTTQLTLILCTPKSLARVRVKPIIADLAVVYPGIPP